MTKVTSLSRQLIKRTFAKHLSDILNIGKSRIRRYRKRYERDRRFKGSKNRDNKGM